MKLNRLQLSKMIHNVISYDYDEENKLHFRRFTSTQLDSYAAESEGWISRANASAGVIFDFITDSDYLVLKMDLYEGSAYEWSNFDLYIDGIFTRQKRFEDRGAKMLGFDLPKGEHRITLYFPWTAETVISEVHLSDGASIKEVSKKAKAIVVGDSITQGYTTQFTSLSYANQVAGQTDMELINQGIGGYYFGSNTIDESLISYAPDLFIIAYGTNDYSGYETSEEYEKNVSAYVEKLVSLFPNTVMLAILPIYRNDYNNQTRQKYRSYTIEDARRILEKIYSRYENIHVLKETNIPHVPDVFVSDYLHPNELGFTFMAQAISKKVEEILNDSNSNRGI